MIRMLRAGATRRACSRRAKAPGLALGRADEHGELAARRLFGRADGPVDLVPLAGAELTSGHLRPRSPIRVCSPRSADSSSLGAPARATEPLALVAGVARAPTLSPRTSAGR